MKEVAIAEIKHGQFSRADSISVSDKKLSIFLTRYFFNQHILNSCDTKKTALLYYGNDSLESDRKIDVVCDRLAGRTFCRILSDIAATYVNEEQHDLFDVQVALQRDRIRDLPYPEPEFPKNINVRLAYEHKLKSSEVFKYITKGEFSAIKQIKIFEDLLTKFYQEFIHLEKLSFIDSSSIYVPKSESFENSTSDIALLDWIARVLTKFPIIRNFILRPVSILRNEDIYYKFGLGEYMDGDGVIDQVGGNHFWETPSQGQIENYKDGARQNWNEELFYILLSLSEKNDVDFTFLYYTTTNAESNAPDFL